MDLTPYRVSAVLFDFDGTLTRPGSIDFSRIKQAINCPTGQPILEFIDSLTDPVSRASAFSELDRIELEAASKSTPNKQSYTELK